METQSGARTALVDPFGRELEEWLRDAPATRTPYVADLVVPPVTGPIRRPEPEQDAATSIEAAPDEPAEIGAESSSGNDARGSSAEAAPAAFRRDHDRGRHASSSEHDFPELPTRCSLTFAELAASISPATGLTTFERLDLFEEQLRLQEADRASVAAWESALIGQNPAEADAARAFVHEVFAEVLLARAPVVQSVDLDESLDRVELLDAAAVATAPTPLVVPATGPSAIDREAFENAVRVHSGHTGEQPVLVEESAPAASASHASDASADDAVAHPAARTTVGTRWQRFIARIRRVFVRA